MADTVRAVRIANERIRPAADRLAQTYFLYTNLLKLNAAEDWVALFSQFNDKDPLPDGSATDGRAPVTPERVKILLAAMQTFVDFIDNSGFRDAILMTAVNPTQNIG